MLNKTGFIKLLIGLSLLFLASCGSYKKLPYIVDANDLSQEQLLSTASLFEAKIKPKDILSITVNTVTPGTAREFNLPLVPSGSSTVLQKTTTLALSESGSLQNYIVDNNGDIVFPIIGKIKIGGMEKSKAEEYISELIYPRYLKEKPIVNIRFLNYRVTVLGEVSKPGTYLAENEEMTIFDAIAAAGDLTIYGKRNNVRLVRTKMNGQLEVHTIDLQDKNILLNKDIYYLQQNDKIFVETNKARGNSSSLGAVESLTISASLSAISILISIISIATR